MPSQLRKCAIGVVMGCILFSIVIGGFGDQRRRLEVENLKEDSTTVFINRAHSGPEVNAEQIIEYNGEIIKSYQNLNLDLITIPSASLAELEKDYKVEVLPHRQFEGCLAQSVEIIKPAASWAALETQFGYAINGTGINVSVLDTGIKNPL